MAQKKHIEYAQAKYAPAGFVLPGLIVAIEAVDRDTLSVSDSTPTNYALNSNTGLVRITALLKNVFGAFKQNVDKTHTKATGTLTLSGVIVPGSHAESVVTALTIVDGNTLTIGSRTYRFKDTIAQIDDIAIGAGDAEALDNLKHIINGTGTPGTNYFTGSTPNADVVATTNTNSTQKVVARVPGTAANTLATTATAVVLTWEDTTLGGGTGNSNPGVTPETVTIGSKTYSFVDVLSETNGAEAIANQVLFGANSAAALDNLKLAINGGATEGTNYSTGTVAHTQVEATTNGDTSQVVEALSSGSASNSIATTETLSNGSWGGATLSGGDSATWDFYILVGETIDLPIEETVTNLSFIGDDGSATVQVVEY